MLSAIPNHQSCYRFSFTHENRLVYDDLLEMKMRIACKKDRYVIDENWKEGREIEVLSIAFHVRYLPEN